MLNSPLKSVLHTTAAHLKKLDKMGITTVRDLLGYFPRALENSSIKTSVADIDLGAKNTLGGELMDFRVERTKNGKKIAKAAIVLDDGVAVEAVWFRMPYNMRNFEGSKFAYLVGKVKRDYGKISIANPEIHFEQNVHIGSIRPVYPESPPITSKWLREKMSGVMLWAKDFTDMLPEVIRQDQNLISRTQAIKQIHFPENVEQWQEAKRRLGFEEIFQIQLRVMQAKFFRESQKENAYHIPFDPEPVKEDLAKLPFELTNAQKKSLADILKDFDKDQPMHRLLQGDVGSGKTVVAFMAAVAMVRAGNQAAILAPTEILAQQHYQGALKFLAPYTDVFPPEENLLGAGEAIPSIALLTGSTPAKEKKEIKHKLKTGEITLVIGTHAILTEDTIFKNLGLAVVDEQHRFGVKQRAILSEGLTHVIAMTATPIPRSLALTVYGDQDLSIIDEKPAGRKEIITRVIADEKTRTKMSYFIEDQILKGRQIFWVCPLVDESDKIEARDVKSEYERISQVFHTRKVAFLHGKMKPREKEAIMESFKNHEFDILVSTSVIEVGVDIPNSTIMVIENSERFGLAQLHQFRGRIGRNEYQSYCFLMVDKKELKHTERLRAMEKSNDGFYLSEVDLELRGAGEVYGLRQSGVPDLKCADLSDIETMKSARDWAAEILKDDIELRNYPILQQIVKSEAVYF